MIIPVEALPEERGYALPRDYYRKERSEIEKDIMEIIVNKIPICKIEFGSIYKACSGRDVILSAIRRMMKERMKQLFPMWQADCYSDVPNVGKGSSMQWYDFFQISRRRDEEGVYGFYVCFDVAKWEKLVDECIESFKRTAIEQLRILEEIKK